ncbi:MFS transporter [Iodidimonas sp. SYSU 1G8]|uniref:spinster family MFS transporter n=1 Tax=Iodidimonas sp. SYSU 1G8 TaxID=3133967 RepID=UPI0031FF2696
MAESNDAPVKAPYPKPLYAWFVVAILVVAAMISYIDRQVIAIVLQPMKDDMNLSDTEISWLYSGFAIFYAIAGLPLARMADTYNRKWLIAAGVFVWSLMTVACGLTRSYVLIFMARIGVGVGEAVLSPATNSMVGDMFPRDKIPLALSVFQTGAIMGSAIAFIIGGAALGLMQDLATGNELPLVGELRPWQLTFIVVGVPGFLVVLLIMMIREPVRRNLAAMGTTPSVAPKGVPVREIVAFYKHNWQTMFYHHVGFLSLALAGFAFVFWTVSFFTRVHGMEAAAASQIFGWIFLIAGPAGAVWAGMQAGYFTRRGRKDGNILAGMIGGALTIPSIVLIQVMPNATWAFVLYAPALFFVNAPFGLAYGALPVITPPPMRAQVAAFYMLVVSGGMAFGPVLAAMFNDHIFTGDDGVRWSLVTLSSLCGIIGVTCLALCRKHYARSMMEADERELTQGY